MCVLHLQIQMKDFRFSYKFKMACKEDVLRLCPNIKKKSVSVQREMSHCLTVVLVKRRRGLTLPVCPSVCRVDVVICLSTTVRNDTLQDGKEQRVSLKCRKQLRVEELEMVTHTYTLTTCIHGNTNAPLSPELHSYSVDFIIPGVLYKKL